MLKHLKNFKTHNEYDEFSKSENYLIPNVSYCQDLTEVHYDIIEEESGSTITEANVGEIFYKTIDGTFGLIPYASWNSNLGTPIGVVVSPSSHNNETHFTIISLYGVDVNGNKSNSMVSMAWGPTGSTPVLTPKTRIVAWDNTPGFYRTNNSTGYIPSNTGNPYNIIQSYYDNVTYYTTDNANHNKIPSPYLSDGSKNYEVFQEIISGNTDINCLNEINGKHNTDILVGLSANYTAANACYKYSDGGLDWHLPGAGEFLYLISRLKEINEALIAVSGVTIQISATGSPISYWTSTEYTNTGARRVNLATGQIVNDTQKTLSYYVRPFSYVNIDSIII